MYLREHKRVVCGLFTVWSIFRLLRLSTIDIIIISARRKIWQREFSRSFFCYVVIWKTKIMALGKTYITCISDFFSISGSFYYLPWLSSYTILTIEVITAPLSSLLKLDGPCGTKFRVPVWRRTWNASDNSADSGDRGASIGTVVIANEFHVISGAISDRRAI